TLTCSRRGPVAGAARRNAGTRIPRRRTSGTITHANKPMPARTNPPTRKVCESSFRLQEGCDHSRTRAGAKTVAGVAEATATGARAAATGAADRAGEAAGLDSATAGFSRAITGAVGTAEEAGEGIAATGVSTIGERLGRG